MKKILSLIALCFVFLISKADAYQVSADIKTKRIPMGTKLELEMANNITSDSVSQGDMFTAYLTRDVRTQTTMILPMGTIVRGNISNIKGQRRLSRAATLYLTFDHLVAPNGMQIPIKAGISDTYILDENGGIKAAGGYIQEVKGNWKESGDIIKKSTKWGINAGDEWFRGGRFLVTPFSAIGGTFAGAGYFVGTSIYDLFKKGNAVIIKKGEVFNILVLEPLDIPVSE